MAEGASRLQLGYRRHHQLAERNALVQDDQAMHQRADQIFYKLASGELPVGVANKLYIESSGQFQAALALR
jgi:hypothetical protein